MREVKKKRRGETKIKTYRCMTSKKKATVILTAVSPEEDWKAHNIRLRLYFPNRDCSRGKEAWSPNVT